MKTRIMQDDQARPGPDPAPSDERRPARARDVSVRTGRWSTRHWKIAVVGCVALVAIVTTALDAVASTPATASPRTAELKRGVDELVRAGAPGALLLVRDARATTRLAAGFGDLARKKPMAAGGHFKIASLTKTYTATVVLQLVGEGELQLGDSVEQWVPGAVPGGASITIHELLNHTSGIADYEADERYLAPYLAGDFGWYWAPRELVAMAVSHPPLFPPGETTTASYSNTNYVLLGLVVEAVTGRTIGAELSSRIFEPLGLRDTTYQTEPGLPAPYIHGYLDLGDGPLDVSGLSPSLSPASGAIVSTATDTATFYRALLGGRLLPAALLHQMTTTISSGTHVDIPGQRYGYGIEMFPTSCGEAWGHNGVVPGYLTFVFASADGEREALLLVNHDAGTLSPAVGERFMALIDEAYCSTA